MGHYSAGGGGMGWAGAGVGLHSHVGHSWKPSRVEAAGTLPPGSECGEYFPAVYNDFDAQSFTLFVRTLLHGLCSQLEGVCVTVWSLAAASWTDRSQWVPKFGVAYIKGTTQLVTSYIPGRMCRSFSFDGEAGRTSASQWINYWGPIQIIALSGWVHRSHKGRTLLEPIYWV